MDTHKNKKRKLKISHYISIAFLSVFCLLMMYPVAWSILTSFKTNADIRTNRTSFLPESWTLTGYQTVLEKAPLIDWFFNSVLVTLVVTLAVIFTGTLLGYIFAKYNFKHKNKIFLVIMTTTMVPAMVTMIPRYLMIQKMGLFNSLFAIIIPRLVTPFSIYLSRQFISDIPDSIIDAARIDGAGPFKIYKDIILPNLKPLIGSIGIFTSMNVWNDYLNPLIMLSDYEKMTLPLGLVIFEGQRSTDLSATMAMANIVMVPMIILFLAFQKQFIKGIAMKGLK